MASDVGKFAERVTVGKRTEKGRCRIAKVCRGLGLAGDGFDSTPMASMRAP